MTWNFSPAKHVFAWEICQGTAYCVLGVMAPCYSLIDGSNVTEENSVSIFIAPHWTLLLSK